MIQTLKTYGSKDKKVNFIVSYDGAEGTGATLTLLTNEGAFTVDLRKDDLHALTNTLNEANYSKPLPF